jgi:DNA polymerase (family 10)
MADYAKKVMKYSYLGVADHLGKLGIANALNPEQAKKQAKKIKDLNSTYSRFKIFHNGEVNIKKDGSLDTPDSVLSKFDFIIASIHYAFRMNKKEMTERIIKALKNENVKILGHPTCRKLLFRPGVEFDTDKVFKTAVDNNVALEINSFPDRMDLKDNLARTAKGFGAKFAINTDAHQAKDLNYISMGLSVARRAMLTKRDVINTKKSFT